MNSMDSGENGIGLDSMSGEEPWRELLELHLNTTSRLQKRRERERELKVGCVYDEKTTTRLEKERGGR